MNFLPPSSTSSGNYYPGRVNGGIEEFFAFYKTLEQSCVYFSTLAKRQMLVGYQNPVGMGMGIEEKISSGNKLEERRNGVSVRKTPPPVKVVVTRACDGELEETEGLRMNAGGGEGSPRQRKVNFANPLLTIKVKSPTPMHSMEELNGHWEGGRTGFTSDSEVDGSETDVWCQYSWRVRNVQDGTLQVPSGGAPGGTKKKKKRRKKKNKKTGFEENGEDGNYQGLWPWSTEEGYKNEDDPNAAFEKPLNEQDYEFVSEVRLCTGAAPPKEKKTPEATGGGGGGDSKGRADDIKFLYGDSGSTRILKMEDAVEQYFTQVARKVPNGK